MKSIGMLCEGELHAQFDETKIFGLDKGDQGRLFGCLH